MAGSFQWKGGVAEKLVATGTHAELFARFVLVSKT